MGFPNDFVWGVATSAYQIEGAVSEDGKGLSIWDTFCIQKERIWKGQSGDNTCEHYHKYSEDVALMKELSIKGYRFSINWPRVIPEGMGKCNIKGMDFYSRLIDRLLDSGIEPWVTLFHWEYPQSLFYKGGWFNPDSPDWFSEYVNTVCAHLGDRVTHWITINEPQCFLELGYLSGLNAPGLKMSFRDALTAGHNVLLSHGKAVQAIRATAKRKSMIGFSPVGIVRIPNSDTPEDVNVAKEVTFSVQKYDCWNNTWWMDPVYIGKYPEDGMILFEQYLPDIRPGDFKTICQKLDFFGINMYTGHKVRSGKDGKAEEIMDSTGCPVSMLGWTIIPEVLYWGPLFFQQRYKLPIVITENGMSNADIVSLDGKVHDPQRIDYTQRYLYQFGKAYDAGIGIKGYFHWTFMDNFEWARGFRERFGLVFVDFTTQKRIPKDSALWYRDVIRSNGGILYK
jgi:beta-glucosidase